MRKFKTLKDILEFKAGYIMLINSDENVGYLGRLPWGWEIPLKIILENPDFFEEV